VLLPKMIPGKFFGSCSFNIRTLWARCFEGEDSVTGLSMAGAD
jgi:hypothetical protein